MMSTTAKADVLVFSPKALASDGLLKVMQKKRKKFTQNLLC